MNSDRLCNSGAAIAASIDCTPCPCKCYGASVTGCDIRDNCGCNCTCAIIICCRCSECRCERLRTTFYCCACTCGTDRWCSSIMNSDRLSDSATAVTASVNSAPGSCKCYGAGITSCNIGNNGRRNDTS